MNEQELYRVNVPHLCAGVFVQDGRIVEAAPILRWSVGKPLSALERWARSKGGTVERVMREQWERRTA